MRASPKRKLSVFSPFRLVCHTISFVNATRQRNTAYSSRQMKSVGRTLRSYKRLHQSSGTGWERSDQIPRFVRTSCKFDWWYFRACRVYPERAFVPEIIARPGISSWVEQPVHSRQHQVSPRICHRTCPPLTFYRTPGWDFKRPHCLTDRRL